MSFVSEALGIDRKVISVQNHGSLHVERQIGSLSDLIKANLRQMGTDWVRYVSVAQYAYNSFSSPQLGGFSPYYLVFLREPADVSGLSFSPISGLSSTYQEYVENLKERFRHVATTMLQLQRHQQQMQNEKIAQKIKKCPMYTEGQLVYL